MRMKGGREGGRAGVMERNGLSERVTKGGREGGREEGSEGKGISNMDEEAHSD